MCQKLTSSDTGPAFREINNKGKLYPSVGMKKSGEHIRVNFGQSPFVFDIDGMMSASNNSSYLLTPPAQTASEDGSNAPSDGTTSTDYEIVDYPSLDESTTGPPHSDPSSEEPLESALGDRLVSLSLESLLLPPLITPPRSSTATRSFRTRGISPIRTLPMPRGGERPYITLGRFSWIRDAARAEATRRGELNEEILEALVARMRELFAESVMNNGALIVDPNLSPEALRDLQRIVRTEQHMARRRDEDSRRRAVVQEVQNNTLPEDEQSMTLPPIIRGVVAQALTDEGLIRAIPRQASGQMPINQADILVDNGTDFSNVNPLGAVEQNISAAPVDSAVPLGVQLDVVAADMRRDMQRILADNSSEPISNSPLRRIFFRRRPSVPQYESQGPSLDTVAMSPGPRLSLVAHDSQMTTPEIAAGLHDQRPVHSGPPISNTRPEQGTRPRRLEAIFRNPGMLTIRRPGVPNIITQNVKTEDISTMTDFEIQQEKLQIRQDIEATSTSKIAPPMSETELIQSLVLQFLTHDGYVETARAFADEVHAEKKALSLDPDAVVHGFDVREDEDAGHRQSKAFLAELQG